MDKHQQKSQQQQHQLVDSFAPLGGAAPEEHGRGGAEAASGAAEMVDYMLGQHHHHPPPQSSSFDKLSFSDVLQFADFGPKLALNNQPGAPSAGAHDVDDVDSDDEDSYFFRFQSLPSDLPAADVVVGHHAAEQEGSKQTTTTTVDGSAGGGAAHDHHGGGVSESTTTLVQQQPDGAVGGQKGGGEQQGSKSGRRKRPRSTKTSEEVESQRMTHIAVERNRRRQMNDYLRVLRSLMPGSYVQRGDQASIIGGAIEFIRELEQLIQCLESQKRRRLYGDAPPARPVTESGAPPPSSMHEPPPPPPQQQQQEAPPFYPPIILPPAFPAASALTTRDLGGGAGTKTLQVPLDAGLGREEVAENKSCLADIEVRVLGPDAMIKVLSRRRPEQLIKTIAALEDMHMSILHTNITTIEQTVLYSFNVKIAGEPRFTADDIACAVHQILSFIDVNYTL